MTQEVRPDSLNSLSLLTALFALCAALAGILFNRSNNRCLIAKNEAIMAQAQANDLWEFYQSRNMRVEITELNIALAVAMPRAVKTGLDEKIKKLKSEKDVTFVQARKAEAERDRFNQISESYLDVLRRFSLSLAFLQLALALSPVFLALRRPAVLWAAVCIGGAGIALLLLGAARFFALPN